VASDKLFTAQDAGFFAVRCVHRRAIEKERRYLHAMASLPESEPRSADVAAKMGFPASELTTVRRSLIDKGLIYAPERRKSSPSPSRAWTSSSPALNGPH